MRSACSLIQVRLYDQRQAAEQAAIRNPLAESGAAPGPASGDENLADLQRRDIAELATQIDPVTRQALDAQAQAEQSQIAEQQLAYSLANPQANPQVNHGYRVFSLPKTGRRARKPRPVCSIRIRKARITLRDLTPATRPPPPATRPPPPATRPALPATWPKPRRERCQTWCHGAQQQRTAAQDSGAAAGGQFPVGRRQLRPDRLQP